MRQAGSSTLRERTVTFAACDFLTLIGKLR
jgi:hypothetical protein